MQLICSKQRPLALGPKAVHSPCTRLGRYPQTQLKPTQAFRLDDSNTPNTSAADSAARTVADPAAHTNHTPLAPAHKRSATASKGSSWRASADTTDSVQPLWRKPSFPYVVAIALATLPYDLAYQQYQSRSGRKAAYSRSSHFNTTPASTGHSSSSSSSGSTSRPARHAKASASAPAKHSSTPSAAPASNNEAVKRQAAAAAAAVDSHYPQQQQSTVDTSKHAKASRASKLAAEASQAANAARSAAATAKGAASRSSSAAQAAADKRGNTAPARADAAAAAAAAKQPPASSVPPSWGAATGSAGPAAAAAAAAGPVDSWDTSDDSAMFSDEDAEQQAKAMVIELLTHPKDTEDALMRAAASKPGGGDGSAGRPLSVSPDYIDALVEAVRDPGIGMPHHNVPTRSNPLEMTSSSSSSGNPGTTDAPAKPKAQASAVAQDSPAALSAAPGAQQGAGDDVRPGRQVPSASLWSWLDASPQSSQDEEF